MYIYIYICMYVMSAKNPQNKMVLGLTGRLPRLPTRRRDPFARAKVIYKGVVKGWAPSMLLPEGSHRALPWQPHTYKLPNRKGI